MFSQSYKSYRNLSHLVTVKGITGEVTSGRRSLVVWKYNTYNNIQVAYPKPADVIKFKLDQGDAGSPKPDVCSSPHTDTQHVFTL